MHSHNMTITQVRVLETIFLNSNNVIILFTIENYCMHVYTAYDRYVNLDSCIALNL